MPQIEDFEPKVNNKHLKLKECDQIKEEEKQNE
jgi:hypothetical protein